MNLEDYEIIKNKIRKEFKGNETEINNLDSKLNIIYLNNIGNRISRVFCFSTVSWGAIVLLLVGLGINVTFLPSEVVSYLIVGVSALMGTAMEYGYGKKKDLRNKLKSFSWAKTSLEKIEEKVNLKINKEKLLNENKCLKTMFNRLSEDEDLLRLASMKYDVVEKDNGVKTVSELENEIKDMNSLLIQNEAGMNGLTVMKVLQESFHSVRDDRFSRIMKIIYFSVAVSVLLGVVSTATLWLFSPVNLQFSISMLIPFLVGGMIANGYIVKKYKDDSKVFEKINSEILDDAMSKKWSADDFSYSLKLNEVMDKICGIRISLEEQKIRLEKKKNAINGDKEQSDDLAYSYQYDDSIKIVEDMLEQELKVDNIQTPLAKRRVKESDIKNT